MNRVRLAKAISAVCVIICSHTYLAAVLPCKSEEPVNLPAGDKPDGGDRSRLEGCNATNLYYGIDGKVNYNDARMCAIIQGNIKENPFSGDAILMMIYANGLGVQRDPQMAITLARTLESSKAELNYRIERIEAGEKLDVCDGVMSSHLLASCAALQEEIELSKEGQRVIQLIAQVGGGAAKLIDDVRKRGREYFESQAKLESAMLGTIRGSETIGRRTSYSANLIGALESIAAGGTPTRQLECVAGDKNVEALLQELADLRCVEPSEMVNNQAKWDAFDAAWRGVVSMVGSETKSMWTEWAKCERIRALEEIRRERCNARTN